MKKNFAFVLFFTIFIILIFINKDLVTTSAINSFLLWQNKIFPSLFIMFVIQDILINYNAAYFLNLILNNLFSKIFKISSNGQLAFTLSLFSGSPSNAFILNELVKNKKIEIKEANHILKFSYFANPLFLFTMLTFIFENSTEPLKIIFSLYLSNIILGIALKKEKFYSQQHNEINDFNFGFILTSSIKKSINTLIMILGSVTFFMVFSQVIIIYFKNDITNIFITGLFEITAGLNNLINFDSTSLLKEIFSVLIISFGGLSVHSQIYSIISETKLSYMCFLKGRIYASIIAVLIIIII